MEENKLIHIQFRIGAFRDGISLFPTHTKEVTYGAV
jgi:hypothetical protein